MALKLTTRARYAVRLMIDLALSMETHDIVDLGSISRRTSISRRYLEQVVQLMKNASLVSSQSGRRGGYRLSRPASFIPIGSIIEAAIGPIAIAECIEDSGFCDRRDCCPSRALWEILNHRIKEVLYRYTLEDLTREEWLVHIREELPDIDPGDGDRFPADESGITLHG